MFYALPNFLSFFTSLKGHGPCFEVNPCQNGGSCVPGQSFEINDYKCLCTSIDFTGQNCSERK